MLNLVNPENIYCIPSYGAFQFVLTPSLPAIDLPGNSSFGSQLPLKIMTLLSSYLIEYLRPLLGVDPEPRTLEIKSD